MNGILGEAMLTARSLVSAGDRARLQRVMVRASQGDPVTVAVIGGSITAGAAATQPEKRYGNYVVKGPMGKARVIVDSKEVRELNAWFDQTGRTQ